VNLESKKATAEAFEEKPIEPSGAAKQEAPDPKKADDSKQNDDQSL